MDEEGKKKCYRIISCGMMEQGVKKTKTLHITSLQASWQKKTTKKLTIVTQYWQQYDDHSLVNNT